MISLYIPLYNRLSSLRFRRIRGNILDRQDAHGWKHVETFLRRFSGCSKKCQDTAAAAIDIALITIKQPSPRPKGGRLSRKVPFSFVLSLNTLGFLLLAVVLLLA